MEEFNSVVIVSSGDDSKQVYVVGLKCGTIIEYENSREEFDNSIHLTGIRNIFVPGVNFKKNDSYRIAEYFEKSGVFVKENEIAWTTVKPEIPKAGTQTLSL